MTANAQSAQDETTQILPNRSGKVYITSQDNSEFFQGWLPGTARDGFCRVVRTIRNVRQNDHALQGEISLNKLKLIVRFDGEDWIIQGTVDGSIKRGRRYSR